MNFQDRNFKTINTANGNDMRQLEIVMWLFGQPFFHQWICFTWTTFASSYISKQTNDSEDRCDIHLSIMNDMHTCTIFYIHRCKRSIFQSYHTRISIWNKLRSDHISDTFSIARHKKIISLIQKKKKKKKGVFTYFAQRDAVFEGKRWMRF